MNYNPEYRDAFENWCDNHGIEIRSLNLAEFTKRKMQEVWESALLPANTLQIEFNGPNAKAIHEAFMERKLSVEEFMYPFEPKGIND